MGVRVPVTMKTLFDPHRNVIQFEIEAIQIAKMRLPPVLGEFNRNGGISLNYDRAWEDDETFDIPPESLAYHLLRLAYWVASIESSEGK